jgi:carboxypeptidase family protein
MICPGGFVAPLIGTWLKSDGNLTEAPRLGAIESLLARRKSMPRPVLAFAVSFGILLGATPLRAQSTFGTIVGTVKDSSGAAVPAAAIDVQELDNNTTQTAVSNDEGLYELLDLKPGRYLITATKSGFSTFTVPEMILPGRETVRADIRLEPAPVKESVVVTGVAAILNTENGTISDTKSFRQITELPLNYRGVTTSPLAALMTVPGVQQDLVNHPSIGGGLPAQIEYSLDGISTANIRTFGPLSEMYMSTEMLSEFKVISVNNSAEYGQMGDVTVITRGGANQLHGSALWYHQNAALDATIYGAPEKQAKVYNTFGGSFSGPVYLPKLYRGRDRTFFFLDYEGNRKPSTVLQQLSVPTASMRAGDLNGVPGGSAVDPLSGAPFAGNIIPTTRINSVAHTLLAKFYPLPNYNPGGTTNADYRPLVPNIVDTDGYDVRIDHVLSSRQQIFGRWTWKKISSLRSNGLLPPSNNDDRYRNLIFSHNFILRPNLINESRFGFSLFLHREQFPILGADAVAALGLQGLNLSNARGTGGFPLFDFSDGTGFYGIGHSRDGPLGSRTWQFTDNLSWIRGRHSMRLGADVRHIGWESVLSFGGGDDFGTFGFRQGAFSGNAFADLLLGLPYVSEYGLIGPNLNEAANHFHFYGQDEWRVNNRLTVNFGLRWTLHPPMIEASGNITNFDTATGNIIVPDHTLPAAPGFLEGVNACPGTITTIPCTKIITASQAGLDPGLRRTYYGNWAPRVSFAWRPFANNNTVVRSGFGEFTQTILGQTAYGPTGIHTTDLRDSFNYQGPGIAPRFVLPLVASGPFALPQPGTEFFGYGMDLNYKDPRSYQWNFTLEHAVASRTTLRLSYVGMHSVGLNELVSYQQEHASTKPYSQSDRPYPAMGGIQMWENIGFASYEALQAEVERRFSRGLFFQASYAYSKNIGNAGSFRGGQGNLLFPPEALPNQITDRFNTRLDRGNLAGSRPNRFLFTGIYELPWGKARKFANQLRPFANALLGGWDVSTIVLLESGPFQTALIGGRFDQSHSTLNGRNGRPDRIGDGNLPNPTPDRWYDITAFEPTPKGAGRFGDSGVGILRGPGIATVAAGLFKSFSITEKLRMRIEGTFTNIANHPNFYPPPTQVDSPVSFGKITQVQSQENSGNRVGQVAARLDW